MFVIGQKYKTVPVCMVCWGLDVEAVLVTPVWVRVSVSGPGWPGLGVVLTVLSPATHLQPAPLSPRLPVLSYLAPLPTFQ